MSCVTSIFGTLYFVFTYLYTVGTLRAELCIYVYGEPSPYSVDCPIHECRAHSVRNPHVRWARTQLSYHAEHTTGLIPWSQRINGSFARGGPGCARATWFDVSACASLVGALGVVVGVTGRGGCVVHGLPWRVGALHGVTVHAVAGCGEGGMHGLPWSAPRCWLCACCMV